MSPRCACGLVLASGALWAQKYVISTVAGGTPALAGVNSSIGSPRGVATDAGGNLYFAASNCVLRLDENGALTRLAGNARFGYSGDGSGATNAQMSNPNGVAVDSGGNLYIADTSNNRIRRVLPAGIVVTEAGTGGGVPGDGGPATLGGLQGPRGVAVDGSGSVYVADTGDNRIRKISPSGIITTVVGNGTPGYSGDGGQATSAQLSAPASVFVDAAGNLYIADSGNNRVRRVSSAGTITTVAGSGPPGYSGDGGPATSAQLNTPLSVLVDGIGNLYVGDSGNSRVRAVSPIGIITTVVPELCTPWKSVLAG